MADALPEIRHVVLLKLENRSFDHLLGGLPGVNGASAMWTSHSARRQRHWAGDPTCLRLRLAVGGGARVESAM
jgi:phospholipase C